MKKSTILFAFVFALGINAFAANDNGKEANEPGRELTAEERVLEERLAAELEISLEEVLASAEEDRVERVIVYNAQGEVVQVQDTNIDLDHLPNGADKLMQEGTTQYYIIF